MTLHHLVVLIKLTRHKPPAPRPPQPPPNLRGGGGGTLGAGKAGWEPVVGREE